VETSGDGSGTVRARAWPRDATEPGDWTLSVPLARVHREGAPGLFGFSPDNQKRVYVDNVSLERDGRR
jgi:hypothetical protein